MLKKYLLILCVFVMWIVIDTHGRGWFSMGTCGSGEVRLVLTCDDSDMTDVLIGDLLDSSGNVCVSVCAEMTQPGNVVKVDFPGGYFCSSAFYPVCKQTSPSLEYYVCLPDDCCGGECTGCVDEIVWPSTITVTIVDSEVAAVNGEWTLDQNIFDDRQYELSNIPFFMSLFFCSGTTPGSEGSNVQVEEINSGFSGLYAVSHCGPFVDIDNIILGSFGDGTMTVEFN